MNTKRLLSVNDRVLKENYRLKIIWRTTAKTDHKIIEAEKYQNLDNNIVEVDKYQKLDESIVYYKVNEYGTTTETMPQDITTINDGYYRLIM